MYGKYSFSGGPKALLTICHMIAVLVVFSCVWGSGFDSISNLLGVHTTRGDSTRGVLIVACSLIYFVRMLGTTFILLKRKMPWAEAATIGTWLLVIHGTMLWQGGQNSNSVSVVTWIGLGLYGFGAYLNTMSEYQRMIWKRAPSHKGKLYTEGIFVYSMHVNYFGDVVAFTGFAMIAARPYAFLIPAIMAVLFVTMNIPMLDKYLAERYAGQFEAYAKRTKKFIPFVY